MGGQVEVTERQAVNLDTLIACVSRLGYLEEQIQGVAPKETRPETQNELLLAVAAAGAAFVQATRDASSDDLPPVRFDLLSELRRAEAVLQPRQAYLIRFNGFLFRYLEESYQLHPDVYAAVAYLEPGLAHILLTTPGRIFDADCPARQLLEFILSAARGYDEFAGRRAWELISGVRDITRGLAESTSLSERLFVEAKLSLATLVRRYNMNALIFEKHIIEKERGELLREDARLRVNQEIQRLVSGQVLPSVLLDFLREVWAKHLYITYLREGMDCDLWKEGLEDIATLVWSLTVTDAKVLFNAYGSRVSKTITRMRANAAKVHQNTDLSDRCFQLVDDMHLQIMDGETPDVPNPVRMERFDEIVPSAANRVLPPELSEALDQARVGEWYWVDDKGLQLRSKLIEKNSERGYALFTNFSGVKSGKFGFRELAEGLVGGRVRPIRVQPVFESALAYAFDRLASLIPEKEAQAEQARMEREARLAAREKAAELERRLKELERIRLEKARELAERQRAEEEAARRRAEEKRRAEREAREQALARAVSDVERMQPGGILELLDKDNRPVSCKLGLKLKSSRKMIFVDRFGAKVAEFLPEQLAERVAEGSASIRNYGVAFDDTLQSLIVERSDKLQID